MMAEMKCYIRDLIHYSHDRTVNTVFHLSCHSRLDRKWKEIQRDVDGN
jgi:hypothetical protein